MDCRLRQPLAAGGRDKKRLFSVQRDHIPLSQPILYGLLAGTVQKEDALLITLAEHAQLVVSNICYIQAHQLRDPKAAVEEQGEDAVVPGLVGSVHTVQKFQAFFQIQVTWQRLFQPGGIQILHGVIRDQLGLVGEILVKRADSRNFSGS